MNGRAPAAGWYADPTQPGRLRYWDGAVWTDHEHWPSAGGASSPAIAASTPAASPATSVPPADISPADESAGSSRRWLVPAVAMLVLATAIVGGFVLFARSDDESESVLGGNELWRAQSGLAAGRPAVVGVDDGVVLMSAQIDCEDCDTVEFVAIDAGTGAVLWDRTVEPGVVAPPQPHLARLADGVVVLTEDEGDERNSLVGLDARTGQELWRAPADIKFSDGWIPAGGVDVLVRRGERSNELVVIDTETGDRRWSIGDVDAGPRYAVTAISASTIVVAASDRDRFEGDDRPVTYIAFDRDGAELWRVDGQLGIVSDVSPTVETSVTVLTVDGGLAGVDTSTGTQRWVIRRAGDLLSTLTVVQHDRGQLIMCAESEDESVVQVTVFDLDSGDQLWSADVEASADSAFGAAGIVGVTDEALLVSSAGANCGGSGLFLVGERGELRALARDTGADIWTREYEPDRSYQAALLGSPFSIGDVFDRSYRTVQITERGDDGTSLIDLDTGRDRVNLDRGVLVALGERIAVIDHEAGTFAVLDTGETVADLDPLVRPLAFIQGVLYLMGEDGVLVAVD